MIYRAHTNRRKHACHPSHVTVRCPNIPPLHHFRQQAPEGLSCPSIHPRMVPDHHWNPTRLTELVEETVEVPPLVECYLHSYSSDIGRTIGDHGVGGERDMDGYRPKISVSGRDGFVATHVMKKPSDRNTTLFSLVALERSIEGVLGKSCNSEVSSSEVLVKRQRLKGSDWTHRQPAARHQCAQECRNEPDHSSR